MTKSKRKEEFRNCDEYWAITFDFLQKKQTNLVRNSLLMVHYQQFNFEKCRQCKDNILVDELIYHIICNSPKKYIPYMYDFDTGKWCCKHDMYV
jgi:hypothetical protein